MCVVKYTFALPASPIICVFFVAFPMVGDLLALSAASESPDLSGQNWPTPGNESVATSGSGASSGHNSSVTSSLTSSNTANPSNSSQQSLPRSQRLPEGVQDLGVRTSSSGSSVRPAASIAGGGTVQSSQFPGTSATVSHVSQPITTGSNAAPRLSSSVSPHTSLAAAPATGIPIGHTSAPRPPIDNQPSPAAAAAPPPPGAAATAGASSAESRALADKLQNNQQWYMVAQQRLIAAQMKYMELCQAEVPDAAEQGRVTKSIADLTLYLTKMKINMQTLSQQLVRCMATAPPANVARGPELQPSPAASVSNLPPPSLSQPVLQSNGESTNSQALPGYSEPVESAVVQSKNSHNTSTISPPAASRPNARSQGPSAPAMMHNNPVNPQSSNLQPGVLSAQEHDLSSRQPQLIDSGSPQFNSRRHAGGHSNVKTDHLLTGVTNPRSSPVLHNISRSPTGPARQPHTVYNGSDASQNDDRGKALSNENMGAWLPAELIDSSPLEPFPSTYSDLEGPWRPSQDDNVDSVQPHRSNGDAGANVTSGLEAVVDMVVGGVGQSMAYDSGGRASPASAWPSAFTGGVISATSSASGRDADTVSDGRMPPGFRVPSPAGTGSRQEGLTPLSGGEGDRRAVGSDTTTGNNTDHWGSPKQSLDHRQANPLASSQAWPNTSISGSNSSATPPFSMGGSQLSSSTSNQPPGWSVTPAAPAGKWGGIPSLWSTNPGQLSSLAEAAWPTLSTSGSASTSQANSQPWPSTITPMAEVPAGDITLVGLSVSSSDDEKDDHDVCDAEKMQESGINGKDEKDDEQRKQTATSPVATPWMLVENIPYQVRPS